MAKQEAEWSNRLSTAFLKKHGYLHKDYSQRSGSIKWTYGSSGNESSISFSVMRENWGTPQETAYMRLEYTQTSRDTGQKENMNYRVGLTTTYCHYGGKRYWFICPLSKNGKYCGRRIGTLFHIGKWFGCRHCGDIAYASQMSGGKYRGSSVCVPDVEKAEAEIKRYYYRGKPTRRYRRYLRMSEKLDRSFIIMAGRFDERFARLAGLKKWWYDCQCTPSS